MEIKNVEEEPIKEYPTLGEISNTKLRKSIPKKWKKIGISVLAVLLIGVPVISLGLMIFNSTQGEYISPSYVYMNQQEKDQFNNKFLGYEGNQVTGSSVKTLISTVISHNHQMEIEYTPEKCVSIKAENQIYKDATELKELRQTIVSGGRYNVTVSMNENIGLVDEISIERNLKTQENQTQTTIQNTQNSKQNTNNDYNIVQAIPVNTSFNGTTINYENYKTYIKNISTSDNIDTTRIGERVFDGKIGSETGCWHTDWDTINDEHWIQFDMANPCMLKEFTIQNRTKEGSTGAGSWGIKDFELQASLDGKKWQSIGAYTNNGEEMGASQHFIVDYNYDKSYSYYRLYVAAPTEEKYHYDSSGIMIITPSSHDMFITIGEMELSIVENN